MNPRVVIVDDHLMVAEALAKLLEPRCNVIGIYPDAPAFLADAAALRPDVIILDVSMPLMNGLDAIRELHRLVPKARVIVVTMNEDPDVAVEALGRGAVGYVLKRSAPSELQTAVRDVLNQRTYVTPLLTPLPTRTRKQRLRPEPRRQLTPRQREVLRLIAAGHSMKDIGVILNLSPRTVAFHKYRLMEHLHVESTAELIQFAVRTGIV
jgi:DNA-binding NarL/FixJ family response regulator